MDLLVLSWPDGLNMVFVWLLSGLSVRERVGSWLPALFCGRADDPRSWAWAT
jgi:hypothetical protein